MYKAIILFGAPGTGKGTQAELLMKKGGYFHFSTGNMFRNLDKKTKTGKVIIDLIDHGNFVPDDLALKLFEETLDKYVNDKRFNPEKEILILDGIPRTKEQVHHLRKVVDIKKIIYFVIKDEVAIERTTKKRSGEENREDDKNADIVKKRLETFKRITLPILKEYKKDLIVEINGERSVDEIHRDILRILK